jgi:hypothetical protein
MSLEQALINGGRITSIRYVDSMYVKGSLKIHSGYVFTYSISPRENTDWSIIFHPDGERYYAGSMLSADKKIFEKWYADKGYTIRELDSSDPFAIRCTM